MSRNIRFYLEDIVGCCAKVLRYTEGMTFEQFIVDEKTFDAVARNLQIIGEAVKKIPIRIRVKIPDMEVCYKLIRGDIAREVAASIESKSNFGFEPEITAKLSQYTLEDGQNLKFLVLPVRYYPRSIQEGKKMKAIQDGAKAIIEIFKFNLTKYDSIYSLSRAGLRSNEFRPQLPQLDSEQI